MTPKKLASVTDENIKSLIQESCVAELIHALLIPLGLGCIAIWESGGIAVFLLWALGNLPFILIQRYNRPGLRRLYLKLKARETITYANTEYSIEGLNPEL